MHLRKRSTISRQRLAANRRNAQKSTGPRTGEGKQRVALNALKHGCYAQLDTRLRNYLLKLGFNPSELEKLHQDLIEAWRPADITEGMLVRDLASLYWDKIRLQRGRAAEQVAEAKRVVRAEESNKVLKVQLERPLSKLDIDLQGYRGVRDCNEKFEESLRVLDLLRDQVARRDWSKKTQECLKLLYGGYPHRLAKQIIDLIALFSSPPQDAPPPDEAAYNRLISLIEQEKALVGKEFEVFRAEEADKDVHSQEKALREARGQLTLTESSDAALDRQIETKVKLLLRLKAARLESPVEQPGGADSIGPEITPDNGEVA